MDKNDNFTRHSSTTENKSQNLWIDLLFENLSSDFFFITNLVKDVVVVVGK